MNQTTCEKECKLISQLRLNDFEISLHRSYARDSELDWMTYLRDILFELEWYRDNNLINSL